MYRKYGTISSSNELLSRVEYIDVSLCLIRIPRQRLPELIHPIISLLLKPHSTFQSFTFNDQEAVLFVEEGARLEFERFTSLYHSRSSPSSDSDEEDAEPSQSDEPVNEVVISPLTWNVLSLDMAEDGERLHELLQPLTSSNIPILYQSAMNSDYLFVASQCLPTAFKILKEIGFVLSDNEYRPFIGGRHLSSARTQKRSNRQNREPEVPEVSNRSLSPHFPQVGGDNGDSSGNGVIGGRGVNGDNAIDSINGKGINDTNEAKGVQRSTTQSPLSISGNQKRTTSARHVRPVRLLSHTVAFHGLNTGPGSDDSWLLKIIKMIGWPESLLPPPSPSQSSASSRQGSRTRASARARGHPGPGSAGYGGYGGYEADFKNNFPRSYSPSYKPIRPKLASRHSAERFTKSANDIKVMSPNNLQEKYALRSRSTSYPDVAPEFFRDYRTAQNYHKINTMGAMGTSVLGLHQMEPLFQVVPAPAPASASVSQSQAEAQPDDIDGSDTSKPNRHRSASFNYSSPHIRTLPFFSFTRRAGQSKDDQPEVAIMTRGRLLAQSFDSSMLIGGSGEIAVSDTEDDEYYEDLALYGGSLSRPRQDEGYRCLQVEMNSFEEGHHKALTRIADTLNNKSISYHFTSLLETINILVPEASAKEALKLLQNTFL